MAKTIRSEIILPPVSNTGNLKVISGLAFLQHDILFK